MLIAGAPNQSSTLPARELPSHSRTDDGGGSSFAGACCWSQYPWAADCAAEGHNVGGTARLLRNGDAALYTEMADALLTRDARQQS